MAATSLYLMASHNCIPREQVREETMGCPQKPFLIKKEAYSKKFVQ
jgi:hypothetical protein